MKLLEDIIRSNGHLVDSVVLKIVLYSLLKTVMILEIVLQAV
jgi:hypothetical protein